jgi:hypothetical protein
MTLHLSHEQLCDLILADLSHQPEREPWNDQNAESDVVHEHLRACLICSAEPRCPMPGKSLRRATRTGHRSHLRTAFSRNLFIGRLRLSCL